MTTATRQAHAVGVTGGWVRAAVPLVLLLVLVGWAGTAGSNGTPEVEHAVPGTVEHIEGSDAGIVVLTSEGAEKIGVQLGRIERHRHHPAGALAVPFSSLIYGADGTVWVYATAGDPLRFQRKRVKVAAVVGGRAILASGPAAGTNIAVVGGAELYGTEFEVGH
jgi:hypothetical protein